MNEVASLHLAFLEGVLSGGGTLAFHAEPWVDAFGFDCPAGFVIEFSKPAFDVASASAETLVGAIALAFRLQTYQRISRRAKGKRPLRR